MSTTTTLTEPKKPWRTEYISGKIVWIGLTAEAVEQYRQDFAAYQAAVNEKQQERLALIRAGVEALKLLGIPASYKKPVGGTGRKTEEVSLFSALAPFVPNVADVRPYLVHEEAELKRRADEAAKAEAEAQAAVWQDKAIAWLLNRGLKIGTDFTAANAIGTADHIAFEEECKRLTDTGEPISFSGDDNCENCGGWYPSHGHRCDCGNRRVSFCPGPGHSFERPYVYAEAY